MILSSNPLGGVCGAVCPEKHCMEACVRQRFDGPVDIPSVQATIVQKAKETGNLPVFDDPLPNGRCVAVLGAGPAGLAAAAFLARSGYSVDLYEAAGSGGGMCSLIPGYRLDGEVLVSDLDFVLSLGRIALKPGHVVDDPADLLADEKYDAVVVATGMSVPIRLDVDGEASTVEGNAFLTEPGQYPVKGRHVAIVGGGAIAADCAGTATLAGAEHVEMIALERLGEMPLPAREMKSLFEHGIHVSGRTRVQSILTDGDAVTGLTVQQVALGRDEPFNPAKVRDVPGTEQTRADIDFVIIAIGNRPAHEPEDKPGLFYTGFLGSQPTTVVEAVACGKNAALEVDAYLAGEERPLFPDRRKSRSPLPGRRLTPVSLETAFFGRPILSPFLLSAAPPSDGYEPMKKAYEAGWPGGVMKTVFDGIPIHIPAEYMFALGPLTYANCDNVSGHPLDRVCGEIERLVKEYPDRLTMASTGGPVSGDDEADCRTWISNTKKLESAGAMGIEYSLSCPQGGDGTKGDIVAQDAELTAKIIRWILSAGDRSVPKLFKLTAAVTAIIPIMTAVREVFADYPGSKAGVTLANTFPALTFREGERGNWDEGIVVGMSGAGVLPISNFTLARAAGLGVAVSGNGGPMDYRAAANFLALGAETVQFCTIVMKYGCGIIGDLHSGLSYLMQARGLASVTELIGRAQPDPVVDFMDLTPTKKISAVDEVLCLHCGNCTRCPYLAVSLGAEGLPETDASRCVGCSICVQKCFSGALFMRDRTVRELEMLDES